MEELSPQQALKNQAVQTLNQDALADRPQELQQEGQGVWATAADVVLQEAPVVAGLYNFAIKSFEREAANIDPNFNPYTHFKDNEEEFGDLQEAYNRGLFEPATNAKHFRLMATRFRDELDRRGRIRDGSTGGVVLGSIGSVLDFTSIIPMVGGIKAANNLRQAAMGVGKFAAAGAAYGAGSEAILQSNQEFRTVEESVYAIAGGAILVGGLGAIGHAIKYKKGAGFLPDDTPRTRMADDVDPATVRQQDIDNLNIDEFPIATAKSAGAAESIEHLHKARGLDSRGRVRTMGSKALNLGSPISRVMASLSPKARRTGFDLAEQSTTTDDLARGARSNPMEAIKRGYELKYQALRVDSESIGTALNKKLAELNGKKASGSSAQYVKSLGARIGNFSKAVVGGKENVRLNPIERHELNETMMIAHYGQVTPEYRQKLVDEFGSDGAADAIIDSATQMSNQIKAYNRLMEKELLDHKLITPEQALGENFLAPQQWIGKKITQDRTDFELWIMDILKVNPEKAYLTDRWGIDAATFAKLGVEDVKAKDFVGATDETEGLIPNSEGINLREADYTPEAGKLLKKKILDDWQGSKEEMDLDTATMKHTAAKVKAHGTKQDLQVLLNETRKAGTKVKKWKRKEMQAELELKRKDLDLQRAEVSRLKAEQQQFIRASEFNRQRKLDRQQADSSTNPLELDRMSAEGTPNSIELTAKGINRGEVKNVSRNAPESPEIANIKGRLDEIQKQITRADTEAERLAGAYERAEVLVTKYAKELEDAKTWKAELAVLQKEFRKDNSLASKESRMAGTEVRRLERKTPLSQAVESIVESLTKHKPFPASSLDIANGSTTGRLKQRSIELTPKQSYDAIQKGFLRGDIYDTTELANRSLATELAIAEKGYSKNMGDEIIAIEKEYEAIAKQWKADGRTKRELASVEAERIAVTKDIAAMRDRMKGTYGMPDDPNSAMNWVGDRLREQNYAAHGIGFLVSSFTDPAAMKANAIGGLKVFSPRYFKAINEASKGISHQEVRKLSKIIENGTTSSRVQQLMNAESMTDGLGLGTLGSWKQRGTAMVERASKGIVETIGPLSGMLGWNQKLKMMAMMDMMDNVAWKVDDYVKLLDGDGSGLKGKDTTLREKFLQSGLGHEEMVRIQKMMKKHPPSGGDVRELGMARWLDEGLEGRLAHSDMEKSLTRIANKAIQTPGIGDTPLFMSTALGKLMLQFQTYSFVMINRFMRPVGGRLLDNKDASALMDFTMILVLGGAVTALKDIQKGKDLSDRSNIQWMLDTVDRSGMLAYMSPWIALVSQIALGEETSRYSGQKVGRQLFGPGMSRVEAYGDLLYRAVDPSIDIDMSLIKKVSPYKPFYDYYELFNGK